MNAPLLELRDIRKLYRGAEAGAPDVPVLRGISLRIEAGEFVAIVGASGSGKSTLMHILGCLDRPSAGEFFVAGENVAHFDADRLAWLRREIFGFVFQSYHLVRTLDVLRNVEMPALYAHAQPQERRARSALLLRRSGLGDRLGFSTNQLSGGQQQRVAIARALMNGGRIILADEPTGALDSHSGAEVMALLRELAAVGHTVILITHDRDVAAQAQRCVEISDGRIVSDTHSDAIESAARVSSPYKSAVPRAGRNAAPLHEFREALRGAWRALWSNRFRTLLTLLGIVIGVASVIVMLAVGAGTQERVLRKMAAFGTHRMYVVPGGDNTRGPGGVLTEADAALVAEVPNVSIAMPFVEGTASLRAGRADTIAPLWAVPPDAQRVLNWKPERGVFFSERDERELATVVLLGKRVRERLFADGDSLGRTILVGNVPFQVIGELEEKSAASGDGDDDNVVLVPYSTGSRRLLGTTHLSWISVLIDDLARAETTAADIATLLEEKHRVRDFYVFNKAASVRAQSETQQTMTMLLGLIAAVSLVVGGIGVMNIMLMTVRERMREIGIRMAVGARQRDILRQFLAEALLVSLVGGGIGVATGLGIGGVLIASDVPVIFSLRAILGAFACALATGLVFGLMPARQAARMNPVVALAGE